LGVARLEKSLGAGGLLPAFLAGPGRAESLTRQKAIWQQAPRYCTAVD
jgi:hypothetical protein